MIANPTAHRRANAFAEAVEDLNLPQADGEQQHGAHAADRHADPEQGRLLALANALEDVPKPTLDAAKKIEQRAQLIAAMEAALADGTLSVPEQRTSSGNSGGSSRSGAHRYKPSSRWGRRLAAGGLSVGVLGGALGGVAAASTDALPGDTLYGLKRGMEDMRLNFANDDADRGKVYLDLASTRLQEARRLMERGRSGDLDDESVGEIRKALSGMQQEASEGHRLLSAAYKRDGSLQPIETLSAFSAAHRQGWSNLRDRLPSKLTDVGNKVTSVFDAIEQEVGPLQKLLPPANRTGSGDGHNGYTGSTRSGTSGQPAPGATDGSAGTGSGTSTASPSTTGSSNDGALGGLLDGSSTSSPSASSSTSTESTQPSVTLPPLLPGLLPGLGLTSDDS
ncbi:DUF5667 domain-containing protein [Streptomyces sp. NBC_01537]|uniref:DUF5667 domain-containing protein n=1 Tax=Streptomyces sp. NBC_01537 TaxID=2903896 RepID=UPI00386F76AA